MMYFLYIQSVNRDMLMVHCANNRQAVIRVCKVLVVV